MIEYTEGIYTFYVYILTTKNRTVLYTGVTNNLKLRLHQHETKLNPNSFTTRYNAHFLIYFEKFSWIQLALERKKKSRIFQERKS
jgi:putative endonuclease